MTALVRINENSECKIVNVLLPISFNIMFLVLKRDSSFEYSQHIVKLRN